MDLLQGCSLMRKCHHEHNDTGWKCGQYLDSKLGRRLWSGVVCEVLEVVGEGVDTSEGVGVVSGANVKVDVRGRI